MTASTSLVSSGCMRGGERHMDEDQLFELSNSIFAISVVVRVIRENQPPNAFTLEQVEESLTSLYVWVEKLREGK